MSQAPDRSIAHLSDANSEKRKFPRKDVLASALLQSEAETGDKVTHYGIMQNVSLGGICITLYEFEESYIGENKTFTLEFKIPTDNVVTTSECRVVWCRNNVFTTTVAAEFTGLKTKDYLALQRFLH